MEQSWPPILSAHACMCIIIANLMSPQINKKVDSSPITASLSLKQRLQSISKPHCQRQIQGGGGQKGQLPPPFFLPKHRQAILCVYCHI